MAGRPRIYETPEELQEAIDDYFAENPERPTVSGMAVFLGFADRVSMYDYGKRDEFSYTIKNAISRIEEIHEQRLFEPQSTGSIFWLKNRGWTDRSEIDHTTKGESFKPDLSKLTDDELRYIAALQRKLGVSP